MSADCVVGGESDFYVSVFERFRDESGFFFGSIVNRWGSYLLLARITGKGRMLNALESFHIYKETKAENQINDRLTTKDNKIFEAILQHGPQ